jgi:uncharacterized protein (UPF0335 family)
MARGANEAADDKLRLLVERVERLSEEKKDLSTDISAVFAEAKAVGYDVKIMREIIKLRAMSSDDRNERDALIDTYRIALGLSYV